MKENTQTFVLGVKPTKWFNQRNSFTRITHRMKRVVACSGIEFLMGSRGTAFRGFVKFTLYGILRRFWEYARLVMGCLGEESKGRVEIRVDWGEQA